MRIRRGQDVAVLRQIRIISIPKQSWRIPRRCIRRVDLLVSGDRTHETLTSTSPSDPKRTFPHQTLYLMHINVEAKGIP
jgi:hypothetical protein